MGALEALRPGELARILQEARGCYHDRTLADRVEEARGDLLQDLEARSAAVIAAYAGETEELRAEHERLNREYEERLRAHHRRQQELWQAVAPAFRIAWKLLALPSGQISNPRSRRPQYQIDD